MAGSLKRLGFGENQCQRDNDEIWRAIPNWEGLYQVSNQGRVKSLRRVVARSNGSTQTVNERILATSLGSNGYRLVDLYRSGKRSTYSVHALVAIVFIGPRPQGMDVCHQDGDKQNNSVSNLRYDTRSNNFLDCRLHGNRGRAVKRSDGVTYPSIREAAESGFNRTAIIAVCRGRRKNHQGFGWEYINANP